jgi:glycosyltransferase involved in cell wall biosynthesis
MNGCTTGPVGINGTILYPGRSDGFARVTRETIKELLLSNRVNIKIFANDDEIYDPRSKIKVPRIIAQTNLKGNLTRFIWHQVVLPRLIKYNSLKLYYSPTHDGMLYPTCPQITTIYDLIPLHYPEDSPRFKYYYRNIVPRLIKASSCTIVGSKSTKNDIERIFSIKEKIKVVYPGYNRQVFKLHEKTQIDEIKLKYGFKNYLLYAGEIRPYKNIKRLIEAYSLLENSTIQLVIVGRITKLSQDVISVVKNSHHSESIRLLGYVPDKDLAALYAGAVAFVFPSLYEGFGLPPLEAMACGCPVLVSKISSLPEVCGDAGVYFDPYSMVSIANSINTVICDKNLQLSMREKGLIQSNKFSFEKTANELIAAFNDTAKSIKT